MWPKKGERTKGSGRKPGSLNKSKMELIQKAMQLGVDPFEVLLYFVKGDQEALHSEELITSDQRLRAATEACQYLYPKRRAIEQNITAEDGVGFRIIVEDYSKKEAP